MGKTESDKKATQIGWKVKVTALHPMDSYHPHRTSEFVSRVGWITEYWTKCSAQWPDDSHSFRMISKGSVATFHRAYFKKLSDN